MCVNISRKLIPTDGNTYGEKLFRIMTLTHTRFKITEIDEEFVSFCNQLPWSIRCDLKKKKKRNNEEEGEKKKREMEEEKCENEEAEKSAAKFPGRKEGRYWLLSGAYFLVGEEIRSSMPKEEYLEEERMEKKREKKKMNVAWHDERYCFVPWSALRELK